MAITIIDKPYTTTHNFAPTHNPCFLTVSGTNNVQTGYRHIYQIFINGTLQATVKKSPMPNGYGAIDLHRIVDSYISHDIEYADTGFNNCPNMRASVQVKVGEEYGTTQTLDVTSDTLRLWNASIPYRDFINFDTTTRCINQNASARFLTTPLTFRHTRGSYAWLYMIQEQTNDVAALYIATYNSSGVGLGTYKLTNTNNTVTGLTNQFLRVPIGSGNIANNTIVTLTGSTPIITNNVAYYTVTALNGIDEFCSLTYTYYILDAECTYTTYNLVFQNRWGGFDSAQFTKVSRETITVERQRFEKTDYTFPSGIFTQNIKNRGKTTFHVESKESVQLNSDWLTDAEFEWLQELITSPMVYSVEDGALVPVEINTNTYEVRKSVNDGASQLVIDMEYGYQQYATR